MTRRTLAILGVAAVIVGLVAGLVAVGAGDDDDEATTLPEISIPAGEQQTVPQEPETTTTAPQGDDTGGTEPGGGTKPGGGSVNPSEPDTATNDKPPPPGSPEERFEQFCEQNPGACGN